MKAAKLLMCLCLIVAAGCERPATEKKDDEVPVVKQFKYKEIDNLIEFRKTPDFKKIRAVLLQAGWRLRPPEETETIFAIGKEKLISQLHLVNFSGKSIDDKQLMLQLINFQINDEAIMLAYGAVLVYIVVDDNGTAIGYQAPFDQDKGIYYGNDWSSDELGTVLDDMGKKGLIPWERQ